jgi:hypothetical protein
MKRCSKCSAEKPLADFNRYSRAKDGRQPYCRVCAKDYFTARREEIVPMIQARKRDRKDQLTRYVRAYLLEHPCVDCGEADPVVLEFDHVRGTKLAHVSRLVKGAASLARLQAEIAKCDVRCANCHRRRTAGSLGWNLLLENPQASLA